MSQERLKLTAIVLRTVDYGESDRIVTLLSRERGKVSAFARGARASRKRFGGALEPFTLLSAEVRIRGASDLLGLDTTHVLRGHGGIRGDLARIACAAYAVELARELVRDHEPHDELFELLAGYLELLDGAPARPAALRAFELGALGAAGLAPRLDACARCGEPLEGTGPLRFDPGQGGALCASCAHTGAAAPLLSRAAIDAAARLQAGTPASASASDPIAPSVGRELRDALGAFVAHHLGRTLAARRFLDEVGPMLEG